MVFNSIFNMFGLLFTIMFIFVFIIFIINLINGIKTWNKNNNSPKLTVVATVISKRMDVSHYQVVNNNRPNHTSSNTYYYVTFQVQSGDRMEFSVKGQEYGILAEGDMGNLSFQGTRYLSFERY